MAESKVQKVARKAAGAGLHKLPPCYSCEGEVVWVKLGRKMVQMCMKCGLFKEVKNEG